MPGGEIRRFLELPYAEIDGIDPNLLSLDVYAPPAEGKHPVLVMIHGGGWRTGDKASAGVAAEKSRHFVKAGYVFVSINYRLSPAVLHPAHVTDVARALAWVDSHITEFGGDREEIYLMGHSAGAHLAALVAIDDRHLKTAGKGLEILDGVILLDGAAYDIPRGLDELDAGAGLRALYKNAFGSDPAVLRDASPRTHVAPHKEIPPFLIFHTGRRTAGEVLSQELAAAIVEAGGSAEAFLAKGKSHAAINREIGTPGDEVTRRIMEFLDGATPAASFSFRQAAEYSAAREGISMLVMIDGEVVFEDYPNGGSVGRPHELASGTKSFCGVLAAAATADGLLRFDEKVSDTIVEWKEDPGKDAITIRHLLSLTSGLETGGERGRVPGYADAVGAFLIAEPGKRFMYGAVPFQVFGEVMRRKLLPRGEGPLDYLKTRLFEPLGLKVGRWRTDRDGYPHMPSGAALTARNWALFGELVRLGGTWEGEEIVPAALLDECFCGTAANPAYGLTWWLKADIAERLRNEIVPLARGSDLLREGKGIPDDLVFAAGAGKQRLYVSRSLNLVVVRQAGGIGRALAGQESGFSDMEFLGCLLRGDPVSPGPGRGEPPEQGLSGRPGSEQSAGDSAERARLLIKRLDQNGDGELSRDEVPEGRKNRFDRVDGDGDGVVTLEELTGAMKTGRRR